MLVAEPTAVDPKKSSRKVTSIAIAILVHVVLIVIALLIVVSTTNKPEPEIVARVIGQTKAAAPQMEKKTVMKQIEQASSAAAASPIAKMIRANTTAKIAAPEVTKVSDGPLGLGEGDFGSGFGSGSGGGMGSGATFFGAKSTGRRFLFVLDHSGSMSKEQVNLRNSELEKALKALPASVQFHVLLFAGGAYFADKGWSVKNAGQNGRAPHNLVTGPDKKTYLFKSVKSYSDYEFEGADSGLPKAKWLSASKANVKRSMDFIEDARLFGGTDWGLALSIAHRMEPAPDVIFFMSDGTGGNQPEPILRENRKFGKPKINTFAMQTKSGAKEFNEIAEGTKGEFTIVLNGGKTISGKEYFKDPAKYNRELK